ncbi:hypothetical protein D0Y65_000602 [Glycine soja]|nr:hypothetical protein D0Y65_000602 [Glycine soja]
MHGETFDHTIKDKKANKKSKTCDHHQRSKDLSCESGSNSHSEGQTDVIVSKGEHGKNNIHSTTHINGTKSIPPSSRRTSSSSSSESSSDNFFRIEEAFKCTKSGKDYVSSNSSGSSYKSEVDNNLLGTTSTYQVYDLSHNQKDMSPTSSPPIQVMNRSGRYDASIVPSSIFEANTNNPLEWSIASNDSLFSIQIGQPSFTRENALMYAELGLSGELTKSGELNNRAPSVILEEISTVVKSVDVENLQTTETSYGSLKLEGESLSEGDNEINTSHQTTSYESSKSNVSILSHSSDIGMSSIAFPKKKQKRKLAYFYNCRWVFCHLWSNCECSNCCWGFSSCWNCNRAKYRHRTSPMYMGLIRCQRTRIFELYMCPPSIQRSIYEIVYELDS